MHRRAVSIAGLRLLVLTLLTMSLKDLWGPDG